MAGRRYIRFAMYTRLVKRIKRVEELRSRLVIAEIAMEELMEALELTPEMVPILTRHPRAFFRASNELKRIEKRRGLRLPQAERIEELRKLALRHEARYRRPVTEAAIAKEREKAKRSEQLKSQRDAEKIAQNKLDKAARTDMKVEMFKELLAQMASLGLKPPDLVGPGASPEPSSS